MVLRNSLAPYIYTAARQHYDSGVGLLRPLYYEYPELDEAYDWAATQYFFGDSMLVAPISAASSDPRPYVGVSRKDLWVPEGSWVEWGGAATHVGPAVLSRNYTLSEVPILVKAGAVVPLKTMASVAESAPDPLVWAVFVPDDGEQTIASGRGAAYEDDGESMAYEHEAGHTLELSYAGDWAATVTVTIAGTSARTTRGHALQLRGLQQHAERELLDVTVNGHTRLTRLPDTAELVEERTEALGWWLHTEQSLSTPAQSVVVNLGQHKTDAPLTATLTFGKSDDQARAE